MEKRRIAVIGAGPSGLCALKNLTDEGFIVTVFEKRGSVGGVWSFSDDENTTSTLPSTISNLSKFGAAFTDFPPPDNYPAFPTSLQVCDYIQSYAKHFDLNQYVQLNSTVQWIKRNADDTTWQVCVSREKVTKLEVQDFDRIVLSNGLVSKPVTPDFEGMKKFKGKMIHSQAFKRPTEFKDLRVLVVGMGNSAADTATSLIGHANNIYLSHRGGAKILPRVCLGKPLDLVVTRRRNLFKFALDRYFPLFARWLFDLAIEYLCRQSFKLDPSWRFSPAPSLANHLPVISDNLIDSLWKGEIVSVHGLRRFVDGETVEMLDGNKFEVDAVVFCTGYEPDYLISGLNPVGYTDESREEKNDTSLALPQLWQNIFPPEYADSVAYMNSAALADGAITVIDVLSMAIAQVWKGTYTLPSKEHMKADIQRSHKWVESLTNGDSVYHGIVRPAPWYSFLNNAAGTGVDENLGYGWEGWKFWMRERKLCDLMMDGIMTPYMYRVFEGKRRKWEGAREAIIHANEHAKMYCS